MPDETDPLFDHVVQLCGFSAYVGPGAVRRALAEAGCDAGSATPDDYRMALPALKRRLKVYLEEAEAQSRIAQIERFLDSAAKGLPQPDTAPRPLGEDETQWGKRRFGKSVAILQKARERLDPDEE